MKQFETKERVLNGNMFYIRPFPAFVSANISGELFSALMPVLGSLGPMAAKVTAGGNADLLNMDAEAAAPILANGLSSLTGDKLETLLKKLLVKHKNISVEMEGQNEAKPLTEDLANEIFCGDAQDMFILAFDVIKANYSGFFARLGSQFGKQIAAFKAMIQKEQQEG